MSLGKRTWVFADGDLPPHPDGAGDPKAHEALMIVNTNQKPAVLNLTIFFEDREPKKHLEVTVPPQRVRCFRMDEPDWVDSFTIPFGQYALIVESPIPIVAVFGRLDRRKDIAYYPVAPYAE